MGARRAVLTLCSREKGGGLLGEPIFYRFGDGVLFTGSWLSQGLRSYSGAVRMRQFFEVPTEPPTQIELDLGDVRGTVEACLNGHRLGVRCLPPYRFDISHHLRRGTNDVELLVTNTLANMLSTWSPTRGYSIDQLGGGISGPVVI